MYLILKEILSITCRARIKKDEMLIEVIFRPHTIILVSQVQFHQKIKKVTGIFRSVTS